MPTYVAEDADYNYRVDFIVNGNYVVPTSASYTLTDNGGAVIGGLSEEAITIDEGKTSAIIAIPGSANTLVKDYELRYLDVQFEYEGNSYGVGDFYTIRPLIKFPLTPEQILRTIGLTVGDIPASEIDILMAYGMVQDDVGDLDLDDILTSGSALTPYLIQAVKYKAAGYLLTGAQNSIFQMEQADNTLYRRFMEIDFGSIGAELNDKYQTALWYLLGQPTSIPPIFAIAVTGTDPVTGE